MTYSVITLSEVVSKLQSYLADERPMNLAEMKHLLDILEPVVKSAKNLALNVKTETVPQWLQNDFITIKNKI